MIYNLFWNQTYRNRGETRDYLFAGKLANFTLQIFFNLGYLCLSSCNPSGTSSSLDSSFHPGIACQSSFTDRDNSANGFGAGSLIGTAWDDTRGYLRLDQTGAPTNNAELDSSWTPAWLNLVGYWKLDESAGATSLADSGPGGTNFGTPSAGVTLGTAGKLRGAASFNGSSSNVVTSNTLNIAFNSFSAQVWFQTTSSADAKILSDASTIHPLQVLNGNVRICIIICAAGTTLVNDGNWHHFLVVGDATSVRGYLDGNTTVPEITMAASSTVVVNPFAIGAWCGTASGSGSCTPNNYFFLGTIDDVAIWKTALTAIQVQAIYSRQSASYAGAIISRPIDTYTVTHSLLSLSWTPTVPFYKALPDNGTSAPASESQINYSSLVGDTPALSDNNLMVGVQGLWHMDDAVGNTGVIDTSGKGNTASITGTVTLGTAGKLGTAAAFDGSSGSISTGNFTLNATTATTFSAWVKSNFASPATTYNQGIIYKRGPVFELFLTGNQLQVYISDSVAWHPAVLSSSYTDWNQWHHVAATYNGSNVILYRDGAQVAISGSESGLLPVNTGPVRIGFNSASAASSYWNGSIDEVTIWNKALNSAEIQQLYRRSANRIKYQIQSCSNTAGCATTPNWQGPDGTNQTYFSELYNTLANASAGAVQFSPPSLLFSNFGNSAVLRNRYFQYRAIMESDDAGSSCNYGTGPTWCSPELKNVNIGTSCP